MFSELSRSTEIIFDDEERQCSIYMLQGWWLETYAYINKFIEPENREPNVRHWKSYVTVFALILEPHDISLMLTGIIFTVFCIMVLSIIDLLFLVLWSRNTSIFVLSLAFDILLHIDLLSLLITQAEWTLWCTTVTLTAVMNAAEIVIAVSCRLSFCTSWVPSYASLHTIKNIDSACSPAVGSATDACH